MEDRERVEELRKDIGLFPLAVAIEINEKQHGGRPIKFEEID